MSERRNTTLTHFIQECNRTKKVTPSYGRILGLDPGETTGFALFSSTSRCVDWIEIDQVRTSNPEEATENLMVLFDHLRPDRVVFESYHIYGWKADTHKWSEVFTLQVIGCIWTLCQQRRIPHSQQSAQNAKGFWTDDLLHTFGLYQRGIKHGRDATRHALHYLCFGGSNDR